MNPPAAGAAATASDGLRRPHGPRELFWAFNRMALQGFGGVLPVAQRELVDRLRWMSREQFVEMLSLGQVLPGPNIVNLALMIGDRFFGWRGAAAAVGGMLVLPLTLVLGLAVVYNRFAELAPVAGALRGMGAVAAGLVVATGLKLLPSLGRNPLGQPLGALFLVVTCITIGGLRWPLVWVVGGLGTAGVGLAWWRLR